MPKPKKVFPDKWDLEILATLYYRKSGTATRLGKDVHLSRATISDRLKWLVENGYLSKPKVEISTDRLRKVYLAPPYEKVKEALLKWLEKQVSESIDDKKSFISIKEDASVRKAIMKEIEQKYSKRIVKLFSYAPTELITKLKENSPLDEIVSLLRNLDIECPFLRLFEWELAKIITVDNGLVKLTDYGLSCIINYWSDDLVAKTNIIRELNPTIYNNLLREICK